MAADVTSVAVLCSGGLDSAILLADLAERFSRVYPLYVRAGLNWEDVEVQYLRRFLAALNRPAIEPLVELQLPVADLYGRHWSITGENVPDAATADEAVYLPGRNLLLLAKALLWCHLHGVPSVTLAVLKGNPFADASEPFFRELAKAVNAALESRLTILRPYAQLNKMEVLERGRGLPLEWTFSCIRPVEGRHCGACNKCGERRRAFTAVGWPDPTTYAM